jgi:hypothetical protein
MCDSYKYLKPDICNFWLDRRLVGICTYVCVPGWAIGRALQGPEQSFVEEPASDEFVKISPKIGSNSFFVKLDTKLLPFEKRAAPKCCPTSVIKKVFKLNNHLHNWHFVIPFVTRQP